jgi:hypothetical protein
MSFISKLLSKAGGGVFKTFTKLVDDVHTSSEEKLIIASELEKAMKKLDMEIQAMEIKHEKELTERLKIDAMSDSWLSKNVRPSALIFLTVVVSGLSGATLLDSDLSEAQLESLKIWVPFFTTLTLTVYGFYFGGRTIEKFRSLTADKDK